ncbi:MAG: prepilin-type N-terminal cleavage/methylation domain-containing protein [Psychrobacter sp.]|nr:prepilin-type N-terminal cleavage/methylation domain-containing protein [Psychrobacter sp.]
MINSSKHTQSGFTLVEIMIVVAIIGVLAAIAYPSYQRYVIKTKRVDMMTEMQNIASEIESRKLAQGSYRAISAQIKADFATAYPQQRTALYTVGFTPDPLASTWMITATPKSGTQMASDGVLSLNYQNIKCRTIGTEKKCGTGSEWND